MADVIERLSVDASAPYSATEAAIHVARYLIASQWCKNKRVLDIACGEGYGSHLMATTWGAKSVTGVDVAEEVVQAASLSFPAKNLSFLCSSAESLEENLPANYFDLIVSLETIEHLPNPEKFLESISRLVSPQGMIILSCPNDHWYYPKESEGNPFHLRKYSIEDFQEITHKYLGPETSMALGTPLFGFCNVPLEPAHKSLSQGTSFPSTFTTLATNKSNTAHLPTDDSVSSSNCSYFVGVWDKRPKDKAEPMIPSSTVVPCSMDSGTRFTRPSESAEYFALLEEKVRLQDTMDELKASYEGCKKELRNTGLHLQASRAENLLLREGTDSMRLYSSRYMRLRRLIPKPMRIGLMTLLHAVRQRGRKPAPCP